MEKTTEIIVLGCHFCNKKPAIELLEGMFAADIVISCTSGCYEITGRVMQEVLSRWNAVQTRSRYRAEIPEKWV